MAKSGRRAVRSRPPSPPRPQRDHRTWLAATLLVVVGVLVYANSVDGPLIYDDRASIVENVSIRSLWTLSSVLAPGRELPVSGRPFPNLLLAIDFARGGIAPEPYHQTNIVIHLLCALVLFGLVRRTLELPRLHFSAARARWLAFASALLWMVHPLQSEAVDFITQRTESLMALCYLLTVYACARAATGEGTRWAVAGVAACALGMGCKESMATAPIMVVVYDRVFLYSSIREAAAARWKLYAALAACWVPLALLLRTGPRMRSAGFDSGVSPWAYLLNQPVMITQYLRLFIWPRSLVFDYGVPAQLTLGAVWAPGLIVMGLLAATVVATIGWPAVGFVGIWFFVTLAPTSSIIPIATEVGAERRMYLPDAALVPLVVILVSAAWSHVAAGRKNVADAWRIRVAIAALSIACLVLGGLTIRRNQEYQSGITLARTVLDRWPHARAHHLLGVQLVDAGRTDEGLEELREAIKQGDSRAHYSLGRALYKRGDLDEGIRELQRFVTEQPILFEVVDARVTIGEGLMRQGQPAAAAAEFARVLQMDPRIAPARLGKADSEFQAGRYDEAVIDYRAYLAQYPNNASALVGLGVSLAATGRPAEAVSAFRRAVELDPSSAAARRNLANALLESGAYDEAIATAKTAAALAPRDAVVQDILGLALAKRGQLAEAVQAFQEAARLDPANDEIQGHLAEATRTSLASR